MADRLFVGDVAMVTCGFATVAINGVLRERERTVTVTDFTEAEPPILAGPSSKLNPTLPCQCQHRLTTQRDKDLRESEQ